jgi:hypothetical protein
MSTDRELDIAVADALGWADIRDDYFPGTPGGGSLYGVPPVMPAWESPPNKKRGISLLPHYSTDIASAWDAVEHLREQGWTMTLSCDDKITEPWDCRFFMDDGRWRVIAHGPTAAAAISRAIRRMAEE